MFRASLRLGVRACWRVRHSQRAISHRTTRAQSCAHPRRTRVLRTKWPRGLAATCQKCTLCTLRESQTRKLMHAHARNISHKFAAKCQADTRSVFPLMTAVHALQEHRHRLVSAARLNLVIVGFAGQAAFRTRNCTHSTDECRASRSRTNKKCSIENCKIRAPCDSPSVVGAFFHSSGPPRTSSTCLRLSGARLLIVFMMFCT